MLHLDFCKIHEPGTWKIMTLAVWKILTMDLVNTQHTLCTEVNATVKNLTFLPVCLNLSPQRSPSKNFEGSSSPPDEAGKSRWVHTHSESTSFPGLRTNSVMQKRVSLRKGQEGTLRKGPLSPWPSCSVPIRRLRSSNYHHITGLAKQLTPLLLLCEALKSTGEQQKGGEVVWWKSAE